MPKPSLPEALLHGHTLDKPEPGQRTDRNFCLQCKAWFKPATAEDRRNAEQEARRPSLFGYRLEAETA